MLIYTGFANIESWWIFRNKFFGFLPPKYIQMVIKKVGWDV